MHMCQWLILATKNDKAVAALDCAPQIAFWNIKLFRRGCHQQFTEKKAIRYCMNVRLELIPIIHWC